MKITKIIALSALITAHNALAQCTFTSGSTGADLAFTPTNSMPTTGWSISNNVVTVTNKSDGVFNFTSIYVETNWVVKFTKSTLNTPVYLLAQSNVTIKGKIDVSGADGAASPGTTGGQGGPGGFDGGNDGTETNPEGIGFGPGGGIADSHGAGAGFGTRGDSYDGNIGTGGATYGTLDILPFIGGSGGSGGYWRGGGSGGGGGALLIASSGTIDVQGTLSANGGGSPSGSGDGSGGAIRLVANTLQGEGAISAYDSVQSSILGGEGRIRLEACQNRRVSLTRPIATFGPPGVVFQNLTPWLRIATIAASGYTWPPAGSLTTPDMYLPTNFVNPAVFHVSSEFVNTGTVVRVIVTPVYGTNLVVSGVITGSWSGGGVDVSMNVYTDRVWRANALIDYVPRTSSSGLTATGFGTSTCNGLYNWYGMGIDQVAGRGFYHEWKNASGMYLVHFIDDHWWQITDSFDGYYAWYARLDDDVTGSWFADVGDLPAGTVSP